jgi:hypothetical protein
VSRGQRLVAIVAVGAGLAATLAVPAFAADTLEEYLSEAGDAEYAGRRIVVTSWGGDSEVGVYDVTHTGEVTVIGDNQAQVSGGKLTADDVAVAVAAWSRSSLADRYAIVERGAVERLGRTARALEVYEDELLRATIVFDGTTGAPMLTQIFDAAGDTYRYSAMLDFDDRPELVYRDIVAKGRDYQLMLPIADPELPPTLAGYVRTDAYRAADDWIHTFYSDGLFSFSVFETAGSITPAGFNDAVEFEAAGSTYDVLVRPTEVWVAWQTADSTMVLVGDLPPDHLERVLDTLPEPDRAGFFKRLWRNIFG